MRHSKPRLKTAVIYVRSSKDRAGVSCDSQLDLLRDYAEKEGYEVIDEFIDSERSSTQDYRPELARLMKVAKKGKFDIVLFHEISRLARNMRDSLNLEHDLDALGIKVECSNTGKSEAAPMIKDFERVIAQEVSRRGKEGSIRGQTQKIKQGYRAGGRAPYGYDLEEVIVGKRRSGMLIRNTRLTPNQHAPVVYDIYNLRNEGNGYKAICQILNARGIPAPWGGKWATSTINNILKNSQTYKGHTEWNRRGERIQKSRYKKGLWKSKDEWQITRDTHEAIIPEHFPDYQARFTNNKKAQNYLLTPMLYCQCGSPMKGSSGYYRCTLNVVDKTACSNNSIQKIRLEEYIKEQLLINYQEVLKKKNKTQLAASLKKQPKAQIALAAQIKALDQRLDALYENIGNSHFDQKKLASQSKRLISEKEGLEEKATSQATPQDEITAFNLPEILTRKFKNTPEGLLKGIFQNIIKRIELHEKVGHRAHFQRTVRIVFQQSVLSLFGVPNGI